MTKMTATEKNAAVLAVLKAAKKPIGPTDIACQVDAPWCLVKNLYYGSSKISPILKRIGAVRHPGGLYTAPGDK